MRHNMAADALATTAHGNYVAASQPGCHIAHYTADWVIETSAFEAEDYGLEPGEEDGVPDIVVDPETRSLRYDRTFFWILYGLACGLSSAIPCRWRCCMYIALPRPVLPQQLPADVPSAWLRI